MLSSYVNPPQCYFLYVSLCINYAYLSTKKYYSRSVILTKGFNENIRTQEIYPDDSGVLNIEIKELEQLEIQIDKSMFDAARNGDIGGKRYDTAAAERNILAER
jgi:hypothetical protein